MDQGLINRPSRLALAVSLGLCASSAAAAQVPTQNRPAKAVLVSKTTAMSQPPAAGQATLDDTAALAAFLDGVMKTQIEALHVSGAVVTVVKDGRVIYAHGFGNANIASGTPIDPESSLFRIGSITKLFTWTAVMQLVEQGKLNLDTDVNTYLRDFKIPNTFSQPVTMRALMTHSAGFEDGALGYLITEDSTKVPPIAVALKDHMPARVRPPLTLSAYSNYSAALAGLIVQQVSGVPYNEYIKRNILDPLDMKYGTVQEPLPAALKADSVTGYTRANGVFVPKPFEYVGGFRPAGSGAMSAIAMTHFMIAHLQDGQYNGARILQAKTAELMHSSAFANNPKLPAMDLGFYQQNMNGQHVIGHEGDTQYFHSAMFLIPDKQVGIFLSYTGSAAGPLRATTLQAFFDRYFPAPPVTIPPAPVDFAQTAQKFTGAFRFARHSYTKFDKAELLAQSPISVSVLPKTGRLLISGIGGEPEQFAPVGNGIFQQIEGHEQVGFTQDSAGNVTRLSVGSLPFMGTERVPWNEIPSLGHIVLAISMLLFLSTLTTWYYRRQDIRAMPSDRKRAFRLSGITAIWFFATFIALGSVVTAAASSLGSGIPTSLKVALVMPIIFVLLTIWMIVTAIQAWLRGYWGAGWRVHFTLVTLAAICVCLFFNQWNLLGWRFG
ncbi:MAG: serine hydrolase domain-containing protein [Gemmatimonadaceae bacterium]